MKKITIYNKIQDIIEMGESANALLALNELNKLIYKDLQEENYITKPSDKKKLTAIKKVLKNPDRPVLECFTRFDNQVVFTDSYIAFILNDKVLPFKYASNNMATIESDREYARENGLEYDERIYPDIKNIFDRLLNKSVVDTMTLNVKDLLLEYKTTPRDTTSRHARVKTFELKDFKYLLDLNLVKSAIDILKLNDTITIEFYGEYEPVIIKNNDNEMCLICPCRTF